MAQRARVTWHGDRIRKQARAAAARGLGLAVEHGLQVSNTHVPIEEAVLERSGVASVDDEKLRGAISYDTPYAVKQHEDLTLQHDAGRSAKYLEQAMNSERTTFGEIVAGEIRQELRQ